MLHATQASARVRQGSNVAKKSKTMANNKSENKAQAVENKAQADKLEQFESALLAAVAAGVLAGDAIDKAIFKAGFGIEDAEHTAARPINKADKAKADLLAFGIDADAIKAEAAKAGALAVSIDSLARAFGKYGKHCFAADTSNGTSLVTHEVTRQLLEAGKCSLPDVLKAVRQHLPQYSSTGHYNTLKRMLKAEGFRLNVWQAGFSITK